jgi:hypothetical protein
VNFAVVLSKIVVPRNWCVILLFHVFFKIPHPQNLLRSVVPLFIFFFGPTKHAFIHSLVTIIDVNDLLTLTSIP